MRSMSRVLEEGEKALPCILKPHDAKYYGPRLKSLLAACAFTAVLAAPGASLSEKLAGDTAAIDAASGDTLSGTIQIEPVIVLGEELLSEREALNPSKFMTVIDVSGSGDRVETVSEVLSETVGVQTKSWGGMGSFSTASIRGSSASQVQVFLDGVPMNRAVTGVADLGDLPFSSIEYIEVFRGITPPDLAGSGIGGAINLVTRKDFQGWQASGSYGSFQTYRLSTTAAGPAGPMRLLGFAGFHSSEGDFTYENDNGTPLNHSDDRTEDRINNDFESVDVSFRAASDRGGWELSAVGTGHLKDQGLAGLKSSQAKHTRLETGRGTLVISARHPMLLDGKLDLALAADGLLESQVYDDPEGELSFSGPKKTENRMRTQGAQAKSMFRLKGDRALFTLYGRFMEETYQPFEHVPDFFEGKEQERTMWAGVVSAQVTGFKDRLVVQATLRHEHYLNEIQGDPHFWWSEAGGDNRDELDLTSPSAGIRIRIFEGLLLKANAGRFYRAPTFYELFGERGVAVGNTDLEPEKGVNWDAGLAYSGRGVGSFKRPFIEYAFFKSNTEDLILSFQNSQRTIRSVNIGGAVVAGHEFSFSAELFEGWRISGNYTFQSAVDKGEVPFWRDNALPGRPMHEAFARVEHTPFRRLEVFGEALYVSGNFWDRANLYELPDREIYNMGATMEAYRRKAGVVSVTLEGKNLADDRVSDVMGYPLPGRSGFVTVQIKKL